MQARPVMVFSIHKRHVSPEARRAASKDFKLTIADYMRNNGIDTESRRAFAIRTKGDVIDGVTKVNWADVPVIMQNAGLSDVYVRFFVDRNSPDERVEQFTTRFKTIWADKDATAKKVKDIYAAIPKKLRGGIVCTDRAFGIRVLTSSVGAYHQAINGKEWDDGAKFEIRGVSKDWEPEDLLLALAAVWPDATSARVLRRHPLYGKQHALTIWLMRAKSCPGMDTTKSGQYLLGIRQIEDDSGAGNGGTPEVHGMDDGSEEEDADMRIAGGTAAALLDAQALGTEGAPPATPGADASGELLRGATPPEGEGARAALVTSAEAQRTGKRPAPQAKPALPLAPPPDYDELKATVASMAASIASLTTVAVTQAPSQAPADYAELKDTVRLLMERTGRIENETVKNQLEQERFAAQTTTQHGQVMQALTALLAKGQWWGQAPRGSDEGGTAALELVPVCPPPPRPPAQPRRGWGSATDKDSTAKLSPIRTEEPTHEVAEEDEAAPKRARLAEIPDVGTLKENVKLEIARPPARMVEAIEPAADLCVPYYRHTKAKMEINEREGAWWTCPCGFQVEWDISDAARTRRRARHLREDHSDETKEALEAWHTNNGEDRHKTKLATVAKSQQTRRDNATEAAARYKGKHALTATGYNVSCTCCGATCEPGQIAELPPKCSKESRRGGARLRFEGQDYDRRATPKDGLCFWRSVADAVRQSPYALRNRIAGLIETTSMLFEGLRVDTWLDMDTGLSRGSYCKLLRRGRIWPGALELAVIAGALDVSIEVLHRAPHGTGLTRLATFCMSTTETIRLEYQNGCHYEPLVAARPAAPRSEGDTWDLALLLANISSFDKRHLEVVEIMTTLRCPAAVLVESRIDNAAAAHARAQACGCNVICSKPRPQKRSTCTQTMGPKEGGVAFLHEQGTRATNFNAAQADPGADFDEDHFLHVAVSLGGRTNLHLIGAYAPTADEELRRRLWRYASCTGAEPTVILGDFNCGIGAEEANERHPGTTGRPHPFTSSALREAHLSGRWFHCETTTQGL